MTAYAKGYRDGWLSSLEEYNRLDEAFGTLLDEAEVLAEQLSYGLTAQGDYWLGYHHGRAAAKVRPSPSSAPATKSSDSSRGPTAIKVSEVF